MTRDRRAGALESAFRRIPMVLSQFSSVAATGRFRIACQSCQVGTTPCDCIDRAPKFWMPLGNSPRLGLAAEPLRSVHFEAYMALEMVRLREGQDGEAAVHFAKAVHSNPHFSAHYVMLSGAPALAGRSSEAEAAAARLIELEPGFRIAPLINIASGFTLPSRLGHRSESMHKAGLREQ